MVSATQSNTAVAVAAGSTSKAVTIGYWVATALFALHMGFTVYAQLNMPQVAEAFTRLGFPSYFRVELSYAKIAGILVLLAPMAPARLKEWAYAGFTFTLVSALIAHLAIGEGPEAWGFAVFAGVVLAVSYFFWRKLESRKNA